MNLQTVDQGMGESDDELGVEEVKFPLFKHVSVIKKTNKQNHRICQIKALLSFCAPAKERYQSFPLFVET